MILVLGMPFRTFLTDLPDYAPSHPVFIILLFIMQTIASYTTLILLAIRYYKSMYGRESYLTHTFPVTPGQLILSKSIVFFFWELVNLLIILIGTVYILQPLHLERHLSHAVDTFSAWSGIPSVILFPSVIWLTVIGLLYSIAFVYFCIHLGGLMNYNRLPAAVIIYFLLSLLQQAVIMIITYSSGYDPAESETSLLMFFKLIFLFLPLLYTFLTVFFYAVSWYIASRKLNI